MPGRAWWAVLAVAFVAAAGEPQPAAALTGHEWRRLPPASREAYLTGILDAWTGLVLVQESLGSHDVAITVFRDVIGCVRDRLLGPADVEAIVEKYADDNPGLRGKEMFDITFAAMGERCRE